MISKDSNKYLFSVLRFIKNKKLP